MNGHVGKINTAHDGVHGGFGYGIRNSDDYLNSLPFLSFIFAIHLFLITSPDPFWAHRMYGR